MLLQNLNLIFFSLSDPTRRDILEKVALREWTIGELSDSYSISLNAVSKHLKVLEKASLISRRKQGKYHYIQLTPYPFKDAMNYLSFYKKFWEEKLDLLGQYLEKDE